MDAPHPRATSPRRSPARAYGVGLVLALLLGAMLLSGCGGGSATAPAADTVTVIRTVTEAAPSMHGAMGGREMPAPVNIQTPRGPAVKLKLRIVRADGITPASGVLHLGRKYSFRADYALSGSGPLRVREYAVVFAPAGDLHHVLRDAPRVIGDGAYSSAGGLRVVRTDPKGSYTIRFTLTVRDRLGRLGRQTLDLPAAFSPS